MSKPDSLGRILPDLVGLGPVEPSPAPAVGELPLSRRVGSLLTIPLVLLAIAGLTLASAPPAFSAAPPPRPPRDSQPPAGDSNVPADAREGYHVRVSLAEQVVRVYLDGKVIRSMICSAGTAEKPTPTGRFHIQNRGDFFFSEKYQQGGKWWVSFKDWGVYLFHGVPTNRAGEIIPEEAAKLGQPASHGCVRLAVDDARWLHDTIPEGAPVDIQ